MICSKIVNFDHTGLSSKWDIILPAVNGAIRTCITALYDDVWLKICYTSKVAIVKKSKQFLIVQFWNKMNTKPGLDWNFPLKIFWTINPIPSDPPEITIPLKIVFVIFFLSAEWIFF